LHRLELARGVDARLGGHGGKELLAETDRAFSPGIDQIGALDRLAGAGRVRRLAERRRRGSQLQAQGPKKAPSSNQQQPPRPRYPGVVAAPKALPQGALDLGFRLRLEL